MTHEIIPEGWEPVENKILYSVRERQEKERKRSELMTDMERSIIAQADVLRGAMDEAQRTKIVYQQRGRIGKWLLKHQANIPIAFGQYNDGETLTVFNTPPIEDAEDTAKGWVVELNWDNTDVVEGNYSPYAYGNYQRSLVDVFSVMRGDNDEIEDWRNPTLEFTVNPNGRTITDHSMPEIFDPLRRDWPTPERAEKLHGVLGVALQWF